MRIILGLAALALAALFSLSTPALAKEYPANPEALICAPTSGDLDYAVFSVMQAAQFQQQSPGDNLSWQRRADGPFHLASLESASLFTVDFRPFRTAAGTRLVAELRWRTSSYEFGVKQREPYAAIQKVLDGLAAIYPCHSPAPG